MKKLVLFTLPFVVFVSLSSFAARSTAAEHQRHHHTAAVSETAIDLNQATVAQLENIKGIGAKKAEAIVAYRQKNGDFKSIQDLSNVRGFGPGVIKRIETNNPGMLMVSNKN